MAALLPVKCKTNGNPKNHSNVNPFVSIHNDRIYLGWMFLRNSIFSELPKDIQGHCYEVIDEPLLIIQIQHFEAQNGPLQPFISPLYFSLAGPFAPSSGLFWGLIAFHHANRMNKEGDHLINAFQIIDEFIKTKRNSLERIILNFGRDYACIMVQNDASQGEIHSIK